MKTSLRIASLPLGLVLATGLAWPVTGAAQDRAASADADRTISEEGEGSGEDIQARPAPGPIRSIRSGGEEVQPTFEPNEGNEDDQGGEACHGGC